MRPRKRRNVFADVGKVVKKSAKAAGKAVKTVSNVVKTAKGVYDTGKDIVTDPIKTAVTGGKIVKNIGEAAIAYLGANVTKKIHKLSNKKPKATNEKLKDSDYYKYAVMSNGAYKKGPKEKMAELGVLGSDHGWSLDNSLSSKHQTIYHHKDRNEVVVAYRGTKCEDGIIKCFTGDIGTDIAIAVGFEHKTKRFQRSEDEFMKIMDKYGESNRVTLTGHSLGGSIARHIQSKMPEMVDEVHMFNAGTGIANSTELDENVHSHHILNDPLSMLGAKNHHNMHFYDMDGDNPHSLENFL